jgi:DNA-directed RNA polymerase subunit RPC12/RpoP
MSHQNTAFTNGGLDMSSASSERSPHRMRCPECHEISMHRVSRSGFLETKILSRFGYYPWECPNCEIKRLLRARGTRKHRDKQ